MKRIEKDFTELDFSTVDFNKSWTWGCGGHPLEDGEWSISYVEDDMTERRYKMPHCINVMLNSRYHSGRRDAMAEIRHLIGL